tara:strand:+ start:2930 stop:4558 length:1629 start_codon:yes stop_codon:yes gene_type:complete
MNNYNKLFYRPSFVSSSKDNLYVLAYSYKRSIFKIPLHNKKFLPEITFILKEDINIIQSGWDMELVLLDETNNLLIIKDKSFNTILKYSFADSFKVHFFSISKIKKNALFLIGKINTNDIKIIEILLSKNKFEIKDEYQIENIDKVSGFIDMSEKEFVISDIINNRVLIYDKLNKSKKLICSEGRNGQGKVRKPCDIEYINGNIFICDKHNYLIQIFDRKGNFKSQLGGKGRDLNSFDLPVSLVKYAEDNMFIIDMNNDRIMMLNNSTKKMNAIFKRSFSHGLLVRPTSMCLIGDFIYVSDRDNDMIQIFDHNLNFKKIIKNQYLSRPTSVAKLKIKNCNFLSVLTRGDDHEGVFILIINNQGDIIQKKKLSGFRDPQGMISINEKYLCISDTLNRRGILLDNNLKILNQIDLSFFSHDKRFLCRVPFSLDNKIFFTDFHTGCTVETDLKLNFLKIFNINFKDFGLSNLRKICKYKNIYLLLGKALKGNSSLVLTNSFINKPETKLNLDKSLITPVDFICVNKKSIILDKELSILKELKLPC